MPIVGHGIDIIETARIRRSVDEHGERFLDRVYTPGEREYCARNQKRYYEHLAGRFAAKEAVLKVLGTGWRGGIAWTDIDIVSQASGQPQVVLSGECLRIANELGIDQWHVSISHIETHATASAIGLSGQAAAKPTPAKAANREPVEPIVERAHHLFRTRKYAEADAAYREALAKDPDHAEANHMLGMTLHQQGKRGEAISFIRRAIELKPDSADYFNNLSVTLRELGQLDEAASAARKALEINSAYPPGHYNLAHVMRDLGRFDEARAGYQRAIQINPGYAKAHHSHSMMLLQQGDYIRGWPEYEWRWRKPDFTSLKRNFVEPVWDGSDLRGRSILLHSEQGLGDALQFVRYVPMVAGRDGRVIVECMPAVADLFREIPGVSQVVLLGQQLPRFDVHAPLMSLPGIFGTTLKTIPADVPYLHADNLRKRAWAQRLNELVPDALRVGICWAGNVLHPNNHLRSIPLVQLEPIIRTEGVRFISLQKVRTMDEGGEGFPLIDWTDELRTFADTAALVENLDLVITICTSVAHLVGALGKPMWVMLATVPDWRWLLDREDSPWYPTARLFRQQTRGDWAPVVQRVADELRKLRSERAQ